MYRVLIVEDEKEQLNYLTLLLQNYPDNFFIDSACTYNTALDKILSITYDFFLMDIRLGKDTLPEENGIALAKAVRSIPSNEFVPIIFITSVPELVQTALNETGCFRYLLKPFSDKDFVTCLDSLLHSPLVKPPVFSFLSFWGGKIQIPENTILFFTPGMGKRILIVTEEGNYETADYTMTELEKYFKYNFFRCHRKYLINLTHIISYDKTRRLITMTGQQDIPLGRNYKPKFDIVWRDQ